MSQEMRFAPCTPKIVSQHHEYPANDDRNYCDILLAGTACSHLDESSFDDELMTGFVDNVR